MKLIIDVGNTNIKIAKYQGKVLEKIIINSDKRKLCDEYAQTLKFHLDFKFSSVVISSVVPHITNVLKEYFIKYHNIEPLFIKSGVKTGINILTKHPKRIGSDIVAAAVATIKYNQDVCVIDMGTATKFIYITNNSIKGAIICPGFKTSLDALIKNAALLNDIPIERPKKVLGDETISCMQSGIINGTAAMIDGLIDRIKEEVKNKNLLVVATGGYINNVINHCKNEMIYDEHLIIHGLNYIHNKNTGE